MKRKFKASDIEKGLKQNAMMEEAIASAELASTPPEWEREFNGNEHAKWIKELVPNSSFLWIKSFIRSLLSQTEERVRGEVIEEIIWTVQGMHKTFETKTYNDGLWDVLSLLSSMKKKAYEQDYSHTHCWNQKSPACGIKLEDHEQCCLCSMKKTK